MATFTDSFGKTGIATDGQLPSAAGISVSIANPTGPNTLGTWNGSQIVPNKN